MKNFLLFMLACLAFLFVSCSDSDDVSEDDVSEEASSMCNDVTYDDPFDVELDGVYCFPDGTQLTVLEIKNDFCPCNVVCIWQGEMVINMEWTDGTTVEEFRYGSDDNPAAADNLLPNGALITDEDEDIEFVTPCTQSNPSPDIIGAKLIVTL